MQPGLRLHPFGWRATLDSGFQGLASQLWDGREGRGRLQVLQTVISRTFSSFYLQVATPAALLSAEPSYHNQDRWKSAHSLIKVTATSAWEWNDVFKPYELPMAFPDSSAVDFYSKNKQTTVQKRKLVCMHHPNLLALKLGGISALAQHTCFLQRLSPQQSHLWRMCRIVG